MKTAVELPDTFDKTARKSAEDFDAWFVGSKVVGKDGEPLVVYHSSSVGFSTDAFRPLSHFGTAVAAHDRLKSSNASSGKVYPVFVSLKNPVIVDDPGAHDIDGYHDILMYLSEDGIITKQECEDWYNAQGGTYESVWEDNLVQLLSSKGYDGIQYGNLYEDTGSYSYIIFRADQVRSCFECPEVFKRAARYVGKYDMLPNDGKPDQERNGGDFKSKLDLMFS